jgi:3-oxoacyl-[acyl-carrier-protein] synthase-3
MPGLDRGLKGLSLRGRHVDIDWVIPHQASAVALDSLGLFSWPENQIVKTLSKYGNTIAASIPLTLCEGIDNGTIKRGDKILLCGTSAGISIGAALITY